MTHKVSVMIPCHNYGRFLGDAIRSVIDQEMVEVEVIVVDDGSTDETAAVAGEFGSRLHYIYQSNRGPAAARNTALAAATGDFGHFLDADDAMVPGALRLLADYLDSHPEYAAVYSDVYYGDIELNPVTRMAQFGHGYGEGDILPQVLMSCFAINSAMFRLDAICKHDLSFDETLRISQDWDFWIRLAAHEQFGYIDAATGICRYHGGNSTVESVSRRQENFIRNREKQLNSWYFDSLPDSVRTQFLRDYLVRHLKGRPNQQQELLAGPKMAGLSAKGQALCYQSFALQALEAGEPDIARERLRRSLELCPLPRTRALAGISYLPSPIAVRLLNVVRRMTDDQRDNPVRNRPPVDSSF